VFIDYFRDCVGYYRKTHINKGYRKDVKKAEWSKRQDEVEREILHLKLVKRQHWEANVLGMIFDCAQDPMMTLDSWRYRVEDGLVVANF